MTQDFDFDALVVGAGVVGLAVARRLGEAGLSVLVIDRNPGVGWETSSRNSEVIHAGIYYPQGSLKARACVAGKHFLYDYCAARGVPHRQLGKLIVATDESEVPALEGIIEKARANGVEDLELIGANRAMDMEPALYCTAAVLSPSTGIIDSHSLMVAYQGDLEGSGGMCAFNTTLRHIVPKYGAGYDVLAEDASGEKVTFAVRMVVNAGGLGAQAVAALVEGLDPAHIPTRYISRGCYFGMSQAAPFSRLIYPAPRPESLGVHLTIDMGGRAKFGPDHEWIEEIDYTVDPRRGDSFYAAVRRYFPALPDGALMPDYAGIRPKLQAPGEPAADFRIDGEAVHGLPGLVNMFGIESPGLTASPALADIVAETLGVG